MMMTSLQRTKMKTKMRTMMRTVKTTSMGMTVIILRIRAKVEMNFRGREIDRVNIKPHTDISAGKRNR